MSRWSPILVALALAMVGGSAPDAFPRNPNVNSGERDPRNWPTLQRIVADRYELSGEVLSVTLRGVELEAADGTRTFVPGLLLHTEMTSHAPVGVRARVSSHCEACL